jgi:hypothetical protein
MSWLYIEKIFLHVLLTWFSKSWCFLQSLGGMLEDLLEAARLSTSSSR